MSLGFDSIIIGGGSTTIIADALKAATLSQQKIATTATVGKEMKADNPVLRKMPRTGWLPSNTNTSKAHTPGLQFNLGCLRPEPDHQYEGGEADRLKKQNRPVVAPGRRPLVQLSEPMAGGHLPPRG